MGLLDFMLGRIQPRPGIVAQPPAQVYAALLALDRPTAPYTVRKATPDENCDLVAEWRIAEARWYELFSRNGLTKSFTAYLRLVPDAHTVRALDRSATLSWGAGWPRTHVEGEITWGRTWEKSFGTGIGFTEQLRPGIVYNYRFDSSEIKGPLQETVTRMGWTRQAVGLGRL